MEIFKIIGIALICVVAIIILKQFKPELTIFVTIAGTLVIILMLLNEFTTVLDSFKNLITLTKLDNELFVCVLKIVGVGYISEFGANICADAGSSSLADKVIFAGKITILIMSIPIINNLIDLIVEFMPWKKLA